MRCSRLVGQQVHEATAVAEQTAPIKTASEQAVAAPTHIMTPSRIWAADIDIRLTDHEPPVALKVDVHAAGEHRVVQFQYRSCTALWEPFGHIEHDNCFQHYPR